METNTKGQKLRQETQRKKTKNADAETEILCQGERRRNRERYRETEIQRDRDIDSDRDIETQRGLWFIVAFSLDHS